jgi:release factor glutamine methyltransferase
MATLRQRLSASRLPRLETQMLWQHVLQVPRAWLIAHDADLIPDVVHQRYLDLESRRLAGEPMAYILGHREFMGRMFNVDPAVLIPRPDTELLVEHAIGFLNGKAAPRILDLGTGSGAIAISIALACPQAAKVIATDFSQDALKVAQGNAQHLGASVDFLSGSWYEALPEQARFDLIVSNPPYIHAQDEHLSQGDLRFEPSTALTDGEDGLRDLEWIVQGAAKWLMPGGALMVEHGWDQAPDVREFMRKAGYADIASHKDLADIERITAGYV